MTQQTATRRAYVEPPVSAISTPNLNDAESSRLLDCINGVRGGTTVYFVRLTNRKQTRSPKRMPGADYRADPGLAPHAHEGWLVSAPTNKKRRVYLHVLDRARAGVESERDASEMTWAEIRAELDADRLLPKKQRKWNHTRITMAGIRSFRVLVTQERYRQPVTAVLPGLPVPTLTPAQALMLQGQGLMLQGQGLMLQAQAQAALDQFAQPTP